MELIGAVAIAAEGRQTLAMLRRRKDEIFKQLLARLDLAIAKATIDDVYVDEVNAPMGLKHTLTMTGRVHLNRSWKHTVLSHTKPIYRPDGQKTVSVVFWPPCLDSAEESSSIGGGRAATGVLGWRLESRLGEVHLGLGGAGLSTRNAGL